MKLRGLARIVPALFVIGLSGCSIADASHEPPPAERAVQVKTTGEDQPAKVILSERAEQRLGIRTVAVRAIAAAHGKPAPLVVPYAAVVYDADGESWAFSVAAVRTYIRVPIKISSITGDVVQLSSGPKVGTQVVVVGAPELVGAEAGISGEE
jgi:hypothetical protein